ncbi:MAG TPA: pilin major subunit VirB2, partial [Steroidobacteraceae bacterium]|nr:pilin major subunit VirB2 [Steroidobacteraceae bacterium]
MMDQVLFYMHRYIRPTMTMLCRVGLTSMPPLMQRSSLVVSLVALPVAAYAQTVTGGASPQTMINNICTFILGPFGQSLAVLGIIAIGVLFMFGRASLGIIAGVIGGIVIMFGA